MENDKPIVACDDFMEFVRKVIESSNVGLDPEKVELLVRAFAQAHAAREQEHAEEAKQEAEGVVSADEDEVKPAPEAASDEDETDTPKAEDEDETKTAEDEDTTEEKKDETQGAQDAAMIARTVKSAIKAQYQAAADVKSAIGAVEPMAFDSAEDIYLHAIRQMGFKEKVSKSAARSVFLALRSVKEKKVEGAQDSAIVSNSFLAKFLKK